MGRRINYLLDDNDDDEDDDDDDSVRRGEDAAAAAAAAAAATAEKLASNSACVFDVDDVVWWWRWSSRVESVGSCLMRTDRRESALDSFSQILAGDQISACERDRLWWDAAAKLPAFDADGDVFGVGDRGRVDKFSGSSSSISGASSFSGVSV